MSIIGFAGLAPGIYQVASPDDVKTVPAPVSLREAEHYWAEVRNEKQGDSWTRKIAALHTSTDGLLLQAEAIGAYVASKVVEIDRGRVRVIATGWHLGPEGLLEVVEKSKEYDMAVELQKAALKEVRAARGSNGPSDQQSAAIVKSASEDAALALVSTLPATTKAKVMEARLEVQSHREALCRTKAENQVLRYFVKRAGGVIKRPPGQGDISVELRRSFIVRQLSSGQVKDLADSLYGGTPRPAGPTPEIPDEEPEEIEEAQVVAEESADRAEQAVRAEDGGAQAEESPWDRDEVESTAAATPPTRDDARARWSHLWGLARTAVEQKKLAQAPAPISGNATVEQIVDRCTELADELREAGVQVHA